MVVTCPVSDPLAVRAALPSEYAEVGRLVESAYRDGGHLEHADGYEEVLRDVAGRADSHPVLVAVREGRIVGSVTLTPFGSEHAEVARAGELEFRFLGVAREAWRSGVAQALVAACEAAAQARGDRWLVISVIDWNEPAHRLYSRLGFVRVPERDWEPVPGILLWVSRRPVGRAD